MAGGQKDDFIKSAVASKKIEANTYTPFPGLGNGKDPCPALKIS
jgi:hypothetical protein